ncbi:unnamed protein product [Cunninghamella blakesleeana]
MATLEKPKPKKRISQATSLAITVNTSTNTNVTSNNNNTITEATKNKNNNDTILDKELEQLVLEPINYDDIYQKEKENDNHILTLELEQSIQTVKSVCLQSLDSLLRQLVNDISTTTKAERRLSDSSLHDKLMPSHHSLLGSIAQTTNSLSFISEQQKQKQLMKRSESSPAMTTLSNVQKMLNTHQAWFLDTNSDYNLCCALAALLLHLYRILELGNNHHLTSTSTSPLSPTSITSPLSPSSSVYSQLRESMTLLQKEKENNMKNIKSKKKNEISTLWEELDHLIEAVTCLAHDRPALDLSSPPPAYHDIMLTNDQATTTPTFTNRMLNENENEDNEKNIKKSTSLLPDYTTPIKTQNEKTRYDLDNLLTAMDRLSTLTPTRLNNQRVTMTEKQSKELAAATMGKTIERLSRGRMENQRASLPDLLSKQTMLQDLMSQIQRSVLRSSSTSLETHQRVIIDDRIQKKLEMANIHKLMDRVNRGRLVNQDWKSPEALMIDEMTSMTDMLTKMMNRPQFNRQRYSLSDVKEREIFMDRIFQKVDKMEKRRMSNQDAEWSHQQQLWKHKKRSSEMEDELNHLFDHIHKSKSQLDNQRASFTTNTTTAAASSSSTSPSLILSSNLL